MSTVAFELAPFPRLPAPDGVRLSGTVRRDGAVLTLAWRCEFPPESLAMPPAADPRERRYGLWDATCFEFFLARPGHPGYWEFNFAPAGHWNAYHLTGYRAGMGEEPSFDALPVTVTRQPGCCEVVARVDTTGMGVAADPWSLAIATVVAETSGRVSFWALSHPGPEPDFHHRGAFSLALR